MYDVIFVSYCGMRWKLVEDVDMDEAREAAAAKIKRFRKTDRNVTTLEPGRQWEFLTPDDAGLIQDDEGVMTLKESLQSEEDYG